MIAAAWNYNAAVARGVTRALLINGGSRPRSNFQSHLHHLQDMVEFLEWRGLPRDRIHIFSADGKNDALDLAMRDSLPPEFWLIEGTRVGRRLRPHTELKNTRWEGVTLYPARREALRKWFETARRELIPGDHLLIFVTDHGTGNRSNPDNGAISFWQEKLSVEELKLLLTRLQSGVRMVMIMSQCYSGTFACAIYDGVAEPTGDVCGFLSTTRDLQAYGCYPEGSDRDRIGAAFGTFSLRSLTELKVYADRLTPLIEQMKTYAEAWNKTLAGVKKENLKRFVSGRPEWHAPLKEESLKSLDVEKRELLTDLLMQLNWHTLDRLEMGLRLEDLRERARRASEARWRLEIRQAVILSRRGILVGVGARVL